MSREDIIRRILERESQKRGLTEEAVLQDAPDLHQVACEQFGAWDTALQYAGVSLRRLYAKPRYTREDVIQRIRTHCRRRCKPTAEYFKYHDRQLYVLARQYFGTWRQVLVAAGLDLRHARLRIIRPRRYDKEQLLADLREWRDTGHSLRWCVICMENRDLATAVRHVYSSWQRALATMECLPEVLPLKHNRKWDKARVIEYIQRRQQEGKAMNYATLRGDDYALLGAAERYFGSWRKALLASGVGVEGRRK